MAEVDECSELFRTGAEVMSFAPEVCTRKGCSVLSSQTIGRNNLNPKLVTIIDMDCQTKKILGIVKLRVSAESGLCCKGDPYLKIGIKIQDIAILE